MVKSLYRFFTSHAAAKALVYSPDEPKTALKKSFTNDAESISIYFDKIEKLELVKYMEKVLESRIWQIISIIATITSLLAYDFTIAFLPKSVDVSTDIVLVVVFAFFFAELAMASLFRRGYFWSFWFWLDLIALVSMIPDLVVVSDYVNLSNTRASKAGKSGRSALVLKTIRMIRFSRLLRVLRVFRFFLDEDHEERRKMDNPVDASSSKVGQTVSEAVTKKVILLVLSLVLFLPWFDPNEISFADAATSASQLYRHAVVKDPNNQTWTDECLNIFKNVGSDILYINIDTGDGQQLIPINNEEVLNIRRTMEIWYYRFNDNIFKFDLRDSVYEEAGLGMCLTFFSILIFTFSTIFVTASTMNLVVKPIARLTELLMSMAGVIGVLGGASAVENLMAEKDELFIVEALCERIMDIFGNDGRTSSSVPQHGKRNNSSKAMGMMASRKVTQITSGDRVWEIDVREKHRTSIIERKVHHAFSDYRNSEAKNELTNTSAFHELDSLKSIIDHPLTVYCLRMFMTANLTVNNLMFVVETEAWQNKTRRGFNKLYNKFCDERSPAQINVSSKVMAKIKAVENQSEVLSEDIFEEASEVTWQLMERNIYNQFLESDYCSFYIHMKRNDPLTLNQLQLTSLEEEEVEPPPNVRVIQSSEKGFPAYFSQR